VKPIFSKYQNDNPHHFEKAKAEIAVKYTMLPQTINNKRVEYYL
jgi:hypothetical protein